MKYGANTTLFVHNNYSTMNFKMRGHSWAEMKKGAKKRNGQYTILVSTYPRSSGRHLLTVSSRNNYTVINSKAVSTQTHKRSTEGGVVGTYNRAIGGPYIGYHDSGISRIGCCMTVSDKIVFQTVYADTMSLFPWYCFT